MAFADAYVVGIGIGIGIVTQKQPNQLLSNNNPDCRTKWYSLRISYEFGCNGLALSEYEYVYFTNSFFSVIGA